MRPLPGTFDRTIGRARRLIVFIVRFAGELVAASAEVAWDVLTPRSRMTAGIVEVRLRSRSPFEVALMANLVTLTPGTLTVEVRDDPATLYVHGMYAKDAESFRAGLRQREARMLWALHGTDRSDTYGGSP